MKKRYLSKLSLCASVLGLGLGASVQAHAALETNFVNYTSSGGIYTYNYQVALTQQSQVKTSDFMTVFDVNGYIPGTAIVTGGTTSMWLPTESKTKTVPGQIIADNPKLYDLTFTYKGTTTYTGSTNVDNNLFTFSFESKGKPGDDVVYGWKDEHITPANVRKFESGQSLTTGPGAVPELSSLPLFGTLLGLGGFALRRRRKA